MMIETDRLILRAINLNDAKAIYGYRSDAETNKYQGWIPKSINDVCDFIKDKVSTNIDVTDTWYQLVIIDKESNNLIGDIGIHFLAPDGQQIEIGCTLNKVYQNKGYASEALKHVISYLFTDLNKHRIVVSIDPENIASIKLVERLGFRKEGLFKESICINGEWVDDLIYAILQDEWIPR